MDYIIRKLTTDDTALAHELIALWQAEDGITDIPVPKANYFAKLLSQDNFHAFVAIKDNEVVGGISANELTIFNEEATEIFLYEIGVSEPHRQQGIARKLIESLLAVCKEKGITAMYVGTSVDNEAAKQLYASTGGTMELIPWFTYNL